LINAYNYGQKYSHIINNVIGIIFLGTPHRGADLADILKAVLRVSFSDRKFAMDLSSTSQTIKEINQLFKARSEKLELVSFWESTSKPVVGVQSSQFISDELGCGPSIISNIGLPSRRNNRLKWRSSLDSQISVRY
jgi:hypothetical protein